VHSSLIVTDPIAAGRTEFVPTVRVGAAIWPTPQPGATGTPEYSPHHARTCNGLNIHANTLYSASIRSTELLGLGPGWTSGWRAAYRVC